MTRANLKALTVALVAGGVALVSAKTATAQCYDRVVYSDYDYYPTRSYVAPVYVDRPVYVQPVYADYPVYRAPVYSRSLNIGFSFGHSGHHYSRPYHHGSYRYSSGRHYSHGRSYSSGHGRHYSGRGHGHHRSRR